jgi:prepilin signal peptidase PulO-like enzyme (type II secretory pathway)
MLCRLYSTLSWDSFAYLLVQTRAPIKIVEPIISPETLTTVAWTLFAIWLFGVGASVGSFLNVVVFRMPAGKSLSVPGSRCPRCLSPIRLRHNIPIFGWLLLRGKCADCQLPISSRYPRVELLVGCLFLLIGGLEVIGNGLNLPKPVTPGRAVLSTSNPIPLGVATTLHLTLVATLVAAALIDHDGPAIPQRMALPLIVLAIVASLVWPQIHPFPASEGFYWPFDRLIEQPAEGWRAGFADATAAAVTGLIAALLISVSFSSRLQLIDRYASELLVLWIGIALVFGWQMVPWLFASWGVAFMIDAYSAPTKAARPAVSLAAVCVGSLIGWRWLADYAQVLGEEPMWQMVWMATLLVVGTVSLRLAARWLPAQLIFSQDASPYCQPVASDLTCDDDAGSVPNSSSPDETSPP